MIPDRFVKYIEGKNILVARKLAQQSSLTLEEYPSDSLISAQTRKPGTIIVWVNENNIIVNAQNGCP